MKPEAIAVPVAGSVTVECHFWPEDDGWKGVCNELSLVVGGNNFEESKKNMEIALAEFLSTILRQRGVKIAA